MYYYKKTQLLRSLFVYSNSDLFIFLNYFFEKREIYFILNNKKNYYSF
ncbi:hypothetical protein SCB49_13220 [unidentified eubacterium SCB49]|nr:hypothetical protein SCB49_13220 [unidentified eubacterium SCB49]